MVKFDPFGRHKRMIWQELAQRIDADFRRGTWPKPDRLEAWHGNWTLTLDSFHIDKQVFTRMRAPYVNWDDFVFRIYREHLGTRIGKIFGMEDIVVGFPEFDRDFVIQGSDERKVKMMFANPKIRELLSYQPSGRLELKRDAPLFSKRFPDGVNEVYFHCRGIIRDLDRLHDLYELFAETLDHLCAIGTAYEDNPGFRYY